jgi:hypothetical protein
MPYAERKMMGFSKGTLHYMKKNAKDDKPFTLNAYVRRGLKTGEEFISDYYLREKGELLLLKPLDKK